MARYRSTISSKSLAALTFAALVIWGAVGFVTSLAAAGRRVMRDALFLLSGTWIVGLLVHRSLPSAYQSEVVDIYVKSCFALLVLGCGAAFIAGWRLAAAFQPCALPGGLARLDCVCHAAIL